jgi:hypothetical protein
MDFTPATWMILGLTLVLGWLLGLMSRSGGGKWKREMKIEREKHVLELKERDARLKAADARIADLERARPATAYRDHDDRRDLHRDHPRDGALDNLDLTRRGGDGYAHDRDRVRP